MTTIAVIGAGRAGTLHAESVRAAPGAELAGVAATGRTRAAPLAEALGVPCLTVAQALEAEGVVVAVPPRAVGDLLTRIPRSTAVLVESPTGLVPHGTDELGHRSMTAVNLLHAPMVKRGLRALADLGPIHHLVLRIHMPRPTWGLHGQAGFGAGVLLDPTAGALPVLLAAAGQPVLAVKGTARRNGDAGTGDLATAARLAIRLVDGREIGADLAWTDGPAVGEIEAASATGVVVLRLWPRPQLEMNGEPVGGSGPGPAGDALTELGFVEQMRRFATVAAGHGEPWPPLSVGTGVMALAEAAAISATTGEDWVTCGAAAQRDPAQVFSDAAPHDDRTPPADGRW